MPREGGHALTLSFPQASSETYPGKQAYPMLACLGESQKLELAGNISPR